MRGVGGLTFGLLMLVHAGARAQSPTALTCTPGIISGGSGGSATCVVGLDAPAPAGGTVVALSSSLPGLAASVNTVVVAAGQAQASFTVATNARYRRYSQQAFSAVITATANATSRTATLTVTAQPLPSDVVRNIDTDPSGPLCVGEPGLLFDCPASPDRVTAGVCTFRQECAIACEKQPISGLSYRDRCAASGPLPAALNPALLVGGLSGTATAQLHASATAQSSATVASTSLAAQPASGQSTSVALGATSKALTLRTAPVGTVQFAPVDAFVVRPESLNGSTFYNTRSQRAWMAVVPGAAPAPQLVSLGFDLTTIPGGLFTAGRACADQLKPAAELGGPAMNVSSTNPAVASIGTISFPQGSDCALFGIQTAPVASTTVVDINAILGSSSLVGALTVTAAQPATSASVIIEPNPVIGSAAATAIVVLNGTAPAAGAVVALTSSAPAVVPLPASVTVPAGRDRVTIAVQTTVVSASTNVNLTATYNGVRQFNSVLVAPAATLSLVAHTVNPTSVGAGGTSTGTVTLSGPVPAGSAGVAVGLSSQLSSVASVPASVTVPVGAASASYTITAGNVGASSAITASFGGATHTATLTVTAGASTALPAPALSSPANDARLPRGAVSFDWLDVAGAASYTIQLDNSSTIAAPLTATQTVSASNATVTGLPSGRLWWRVRANDAAGNPGAWSATRRIELR